MAIYPLAFALDVLTDHSTSFCGRIARVLDRAIALGFILAAVAFPQVPTQQIRLPECPNTPTSNWDHCTGTYTTITRDRYNGEFHKGRFNGQGNITTARGNKYVGEFRDGKFEGKGTYTWANGDRCVCEFRDGRLDGQGTRTLANGDRYIGGFHDWKYSGKGTLTQENGDTYIGEFRDGKADGQGTETGGNGDKYIGGFRDGKFEKGTYIHADGAIYVGEFRDNKANGEGLLTDANGIKSEGQFRDGIYIGPSGFEVKLVKQNGVLLVPVLINNKIPLDFVLDSGAADVSIPADVVSTLIRTGTLTESDFTGRTTYILADGSKSAFSDIPDQVA